MNRTVRPRSWFTVVATLALVATGCAKSTSSPTSTTIAGTTAAASSGPTTVAPTAATTRPAGSATTAATVTKSSAATPAPQPDFAKAFPTLGPPTGQRITIGLVNTEGTPGLDFPEMRLNIAGAVDYLNLHGGFGGRPIKLETCTAKGSPETSQACAQELVGKKVEMVLLGLDLFPDYATYTAANVPVVGVLPILPADYQANALFLTGGNATLGGAMAAVAKDHFKAKTVAIISSDNPGSNSSEASLAAALDVAGIAHTTVKGGDNETDAGYQGLMRSAAKGNPDLLVSLYSDAGCIGAIRGRAALRITVPVLTTGICSSKKVLDVVGDDAVGWVFTGVQTQQDTPELGVLKEILAPVLKVPPAKIDSGALGLGALALFEIMSLAMYADMLQADGKPVTGASVFSFLGSTKGLKLWPGQGSIDCGVSPKYPSICSFTFPFAEYKAGGEVLTIPGLVAVSSREYLP
jgi:ABC-type branched-subunit amino acid transport system substrate-binding protein